MRRFLFTFLCLTVSAMVLPAVSQAVSFTGLGFLPGGTQSSPSGVSSDGSVVVGTGDYSCNFTPNCQQAFRWTSNGGMVGLGALPGGSVGGPGIVSQAYGVSADGSVAVGTGQILGPGGGFRAFRWTASGGLVGLGVLPGQSSSSAYGVSADGSVVVGQSTDAFRWTSSGGMVDLGVLPGGMGSRALGVSADGAVVVGENQYSTTNQAFRWTSSGGMVGLGFLPGGNSSSAHGASADGSVVVGADTVSGLLHAFRWTAGSGMVDLGFLPGGTSSQAQAVSADGSVVVGGDLNLGQAFIWDATHGMRSLKQLLTQDGLNLTGWTLQIADGISPDGSTIVGFGADPGGKQEAWLANLATIPEPGTGLLVLTGLAGLAVRRRSARGASRGEHTSL